jgi:hypothetical protein
MAEFDMEQIQEFAHNWFRGGREPDLAQKFLAQLTDNPSVKELTTCPLLLTILCWTFEVGYDLPKNRCSLYDNLVQVLSIRWDTHRRIHRDRIYPEQLTHRRMAKMLSEIAYSAFALEPKKIHWRKWELEEQIRHYIQDIPGIQPIISLDSIAEAKAHSATSIRNEDYKTDIILSMFQTNYGLLTAQSTDVYTFSHLSFQEYFTACYILDRQDPLLFNLVVEQHLSDRQWREVFLIIAGRLADGNDLLKQMFYYADTLIRDSEPIQQMLGWLNRVTKSAKVASSSWRMFWLTVDFDIDLYVDNSIDIDRILAQKLAAKMRQFNADRGKIVPRSPECKVRIYLAVIHALVNEYALGKDENFKDFTSYNKNTLEIDENYNVRHKLEETLKAVHHIDDEALAQELTSLLDSLPSAQDSTDQWQSWKSDLQRLMIKHLDIGHAVQFHPDDMQALEDYLYVVDLMFDCMQADSSTSRVIREEIVDHLLLPSNTIPPHLFPRQKD